ncbi:MAG: choice-of-anchor D domain-containing protein [bacterium]|nr:choice-of-anchor D domain-containing protein [bacterium]
MMKKYALMLLFILPLLWMSFASPAPAFGATITVNTLTDESLALPDNGNCSIREAIQGANTDTVVDNCVQGAGADTIVFGGGAASGTITFTGNISVITTVIIDGGDDVILSGGGTQQLFTLGSSSSDLTLTNITIEDGFSAGAAGAILANGAGSALSIVNSLVQDNSADGTGGAILTDGSLTITNSVFQNNSAGVDGGAIDHSSSSSLTVTNSVFIGNTAGTDGGNTSGSGGAIYHSGAVLGPSAITSSYFLNNQVDNAESFDGGGAVYHGSGIMAITASIFLANNVDGDDAHGGAVFNNSSDDFAMTINYSHFGEFLGVLLPVGLIPDITIPGPDFDVMTAIGVGSANTVTGTSTSTSGGGAIFNNGPILITGTSFIANSSSNHGGAFMNIASIGDLFPLPSIGERAVIGNSTFTLNTATNQGGAIQHGLPGNVDDLLELRNVTIANNTAASGDGIFSVDGESPSISQFDDLYLVNTIIANDSCAGGSLGNGNLSVSGNNVVFGGTCAIVQQDGASSPATPITTDPNLSSPELAFNLGNIFTIVLSLGANSSASGAGDPVVCIAPPVLNLDQRGDPILGFRPQGAPNCDIGAYESDQTAPQEINVRDGADTVDIPVGTVANVTDGTDFGTTPVGTPDVATFIIQNTGGTNLTIGLVTVPAGFTVSTTPTTPVAGAGQTTLGITCSATTAGTYSGTVSIPNNDSDENPYTFDITCFVQGPEIEVRNAPNVIVITDGDVTPDVTDGTDFGTTPQLTAITRDFTINNLGDTNLTISNVTVTGDFSISVPPTSVINGGGSTQFTVQCDAINSGVQNGTVTIDNDDFNENPYTFAVTCNVTPNAPEIVVRGNATNITDGDVTPDPADDTDFGPTLTGTPITRTFEVENTGSSDLDFVGNITTIGNFSIFAQPALDPLPAGNTTTFTVQCDAGTAGNQLGTVTIANDDPNENPFTFNVACQVTDPAPEINVQGNLVTIADGDITPDLADHTDFGTTTVGTPITRTFTVQNTGTANLNITSYATSSIDFSISGTPLLVIPPATSTTFDVNCLALSASTFNAFVQIDSDDSDEAIYTFNITCTVNPLVPEINVQGNAVTIVDGDVTPDLADHTDFGTTTVGTPVSRTFTVQNTGTGNLNITSYATSSIDFSISGTPLLVIPPATSTTFDVNCLAVSTGTFNAFVQIDSDDSDEAIYTFNISCTVNPLPPEMNVIGNAVSIADGDITPSFADHTQFAATTVSSPVSRTFTIENTGTGTLTLGTITLPAGFSLTTPPAVTVAPAGNTTFTVQCDAASAAPFTGQISIVNDDSDENPYNFTISCVVSAAPEPEINVQGNGLDIANGDNTPALADDTDFGATIMGTPITNTFTIQNLGSQTLTITGAVTITDPVNFTVTQPAGTIGIGLDSTFDVQCTAVATGSFTATVSIPNDDSDENPYTFDVTCDVNMPAPIIQVQGNSTVIVDGVIAPNAGDHTLFATTSVGVPTSRTFTILNTGTGNLTVAVTALTTPFSVTLAPVSPVTNGNPTTFTIECNSASAGNFTATVEITNNDATPNANPFTFGIECPVTAVAAPEINVLGNATTIADGDAIPSALDDTDFGGTPVGTPITRTYTIENTGTGNLTLTLPVTVPAGFTVTVPPAATVAPAGNTTFTVRCDAASVGPFSGQISITNDDSDENPYNFTIECDVTSVDPEINVIGNAVNILDGDTTPDVADDTDFGTTAVTVNVSRTFTIENLGVNNLTVSIPALTAPFSVTLAPTSPVAGSTSTTFTVQCDASTIGSFTTTVSITNNDSDENPYTFDVACVVSANAPEMNVLGNTVSIADGDTTPSALDFTDFGTTNVGIPLSRTFTIENLGVLNLTVGAITVPAGFTLTTPPTSPVTPAGSTTFTVQCDASIANTYSGTVSIVNNDANENPYEFDITCAVNLAATSADLSLSKTVSDTTPQIGDTITYTVTVNNNGPDATTNVEVVDTLPPTVTYVVGSFAVTQGTVVEGVGILTWTVGTLGNPSSATLTFDVVVNGNPGITTNYAQVTASDIADINSTVNNGTPPTPNEDDEAEVSFLFDPPFGRKAFTEAGANVLEWTIVWANPSNNPVVVSMSDPLLGGTTFVAGSLTCTTFGTSTQTVCQHNAGTNEIEFTGVIDPNPGATLATIDSASNRLVIVYRVLVPDGVAVVPNTATLTTSNDDVVTVTNTYTRTITPPTTGGGGTPTTTTGSVLDTVKALPATGETPWWADVNRALLLALIPITMLGAGGYWTMKRRRNTR